MDPQAEANAIYTPALQAIQSQTPQIQQLYQTLMQGLQQQSMAQQQNVVNSAQQRGLTAPTLGTQVAGAYGQDLNLISAQLSAQQTGDVAGLNQQVGKTNVARVGSVNDLAQSLQKESMESQQNAYTMQDIERKAQLEQQQNQQQFELQRVKFEQAQREAARRAYSTASNAAADMDLESFVSNTSASLRKLTGGDGKVSPETFKQALSLWVQKGLPASEFINKYDRFVNKSHVQDYYGTPKRATGPILNMNQLRY